jgi:hypothetical protein
MLSTVGIAFLFVVVAGCFGDGAAFASDFAKWNSTCDQDGQGMTLYGEGIQ